MNITQKDWLLGYTKNVQLWLSKFQKPKIETIYFGGGTPSLMEPVIISKLLETIHKNHSFSENIEISLEANPSSIETRKLKDYASAGVNRISIGVQSFIDKDLKSLGRRHTAEEAIFAINTSLNIFDNVNFDLIYGRQFQNIKEWEKELQFGISLGSQHLSLYQLTIENNTAFGMLFDKGKLKGLPDEEMSRNYFFSTNELCASQGFHAYEISNFARDGYRCKHNLNYWKCGNFLGIGPGAHGRYQFNENRFSYYNNKGPEIWLKKALKGELATSKRTTMSPSDHFEEFVLMGLRLSEGLNLSNIKKYFGARFNKNTIDELISSDFIVIDHDCLKVLPKGKILLDYITKELIYSFHSC